MIDGGGKKEEYVSPYEEMAGGAHTKPTTHSRILKTINSNPLLTIGGEYNDNGIKAIANKFHKKDKPSTSNFSNKLNLFKKNPSRNTDSNKRLIFNFGGYKYTAQPIVKEIGGVKTFLLKIISAEEIKNKK